MGEVYRAWDPRLKREVAIKVLHSDTVEDPGRRQRLLEEAQAAGGLNHPNIVAVYDVGVDQGRLYIVSEYIHGKELREEIDRGAVPLRRFLDLATQMAAGLRAAHDAGIVHRDFKPTNVMVTRDGRVKIVDFGLAKAFALAPGDGSAHEAMTVTLPGTVAGTPQYMSPEQARGGEVDFRTDQFSFGLVLYEMSTGAHPFRRDSSPETMAAIIADEARPIAELNSRVPAPLRWLIDRCLSKDPEDRYGSTADLFKDLTTLKNRLTEMTGEESRSIEAVKKPSRKGLALGTALVGLVAAIVALWLLPRRLPPAPRFTPLVTDARFQGAPAWSPDGNTLAYVSTVDGVFQLFTRSLASPQFSQLTNARFDATDPFWSPDNTRIYYNSLAEEWESLWSIGAAGGTPNLVISNAIGGTMSPDGRTIAYFREEATTPSLVGVERSIWLASPDGTNARAFPEPPFAGQTFVDGALRFSPDGSKLLAWVWGWTNSGSNVPSSEFWILPWPTGPPYRVLTSLTRAAPAAASFDWMPDSRHIVVSLWDEETSSTHLWTADTLSGQSVQITSTPGSENRPDLSPDGGRLAFTDEAIDFDLVEIPLNGAPPRTLLATSRSELDPTFSKDGNEYAYVSDKGGMLRIWYRSRDGKFENVVVGPDQFPGDRTLALGAPSLSPDGQRIAYQRYTEKSGYQIWVSTLAGAGNPVQLSPGSFYQDAPTWSPDGQTVAFLHRTKDYLSTLAVTRVGAGGEPQTILNNVVTLTARPQWSPDGQWILCDTHAGLLIVSPDGKTQRTISEDLWIANAWSGDSTRILGLREADDRPRHYALASLDLQTGREQILNPDLGVIPPAAQPIRGLAMLGNDVLVTSVASARSDILVLEGFTPPRTLFQQLFFWK
jgi:serine/threonine protein kinase